LLHVDVVAFIFVLYRHPLNAKTSYYAMFLHLLARLSVLIGDGVKTQYYLNPMIIVFSLKMSRLRAN